MSMVENIGLKVHILFSTIFSSEFVTIWVVTIGGGGSRQAVTNGDKGRRGVKIGIFTVTYFLNGP